MEISLQGCRIHYETYGPSVPARPIVFLHGWGCDGSIFSLITTAIAEKAPVVVVDFPGHGKSADPPEPWGVPEYSEAIRLLLEELGHSQVDMIAHSFGGRVAIYLSSHYPKLVRRMVLTGAAGIKKAPSPTQRKRTARFKRMNKWLNTVKTVAPLRPVAEKWQAKLRARYGSPDYVKLNEVMRTSFVRIVNQDLLPMLPQVQASTLLLWGSNDTETPLWMGREMEKDIPDAGLVVLEGGSHFAFLEQWQRFLLISQTFLLEESNDGD